MLLVVAEPDLKLRRLDLAHRASAIDEVLGDMPDLGDMKVAGNQFSVIKDEPDGPVDLGEEMAFEGGQLHGGNECEETPEPQPRLCAQPGRTAAMPRCVVGP